MKAQTLRWLLKALATAALVFPSVVHAQDALQIVKLRTEKLALHDKPNGAKTAEYPRDKFKGPWRIIGSPTDGFLQVEVGGARYWVKQYAVETDKVIRTTADAECSAVVAGARPKETSTRGIGERCNK